MDFSSWGAFWASVEAILDGRFGTPISIVAIILGSIIVRVVLTFVIRRVVHRVVSGVKKVTDLPVIPKLTPNVTDVASFARASEEAGADAVSLVNTFPAMAIDVETRRPRLGYGAGGLSGPAVHTPAVGMVRRVYEDVTRDAGVPIIGLGGVQTWEHAAAFILASRAAPNRKKCANGMKQTGARIRRGSAAQRTGAEVSECRSGVEVAICVSSGESGR